ncbi:MAG: RepB family DNA primase [Oscillospiraceae bacterium]|jgi:putative DNA primase/helicase|nr:RepB family DNA primase [Oscillospiraceae bacterium]
MADLHISPEEFLSAFFQPHEEVCFQIIDDHKGSAFAGAKLDQQRGHFDKIADELQRHNALSRGIFFAVNLGGHTNADITRINAQFVDMDSGTSEEQDARIADFALPPSLVVRTARGHHCYWLMKNAAVDRFTHVQRQLVKQFDGDASCINLARVLRLPGFNHCKGEPVPIACVKFSPELRYTQEQLSQALPDVPEEPAPGATSTIKDRGTQKGLKLVARCPFMKYCKTHAAALPEPL